MVMKKLIIACLGIFYLVSCTDQLRTDEKQMAENVTYGTSAKYLLSGSIDGISQWYTKAGITSDQFNAPAQYYQQLFSVKSQTYEEFAMPVASWDAELGLLKPVKAGIDLAKTENEPLIEGALTVLKAFMFSHITNLWGDVPYTEALAGRDGIFFPKFDAQKDIYDGLLSELDKAIALMESASNLKEPQFDLIYAGDKTKWVKFANSLKIRLLVKSYDAYKKAGIDNGAKLAAIVSSGKYFTAIGDNASYQYLGTATTTSWPLGKSFNDVSSAELTRRKPSTTFVNTLKNLGDPRLTGWIAPALIPWANASGTSTVTDRYGYTYAVKQQNVSEDLTGVSAGYPVGQMYVGMPVGLTNNAVRFGQTSPAAGAYDNNRTSSFGLIFRQDKDPLLRLTLLQACEVNLNLAEAAQKGWITGTAKTFYDAGITLNMQRWNIPAGEISTYIANPLVSLNGTNNLEKIATQKWLALFTVGVEGFFDYRRTGLPSTLVAALPTMQYGFPYRWRYPTAERDNNREKYDAAVARQGADDQYTKMWLLK
jgi:hypothetical protein